MPYQKEQLKYSVLGVIIGSLLWLILDQVYIALDFSPYWTPHNLAVSLGVFLGVFLVLSTVAKMKKTSFSLTSPVFLIYFAITFTIRLIGEVIYYNSIPFPIDIPLYEFLLPWLEYVVPHHAVFSLIGVAAGIVMVRFSSKLRYDAFYFIFSSLIGVGAGTILIKLSWMVRFAVSYSPLYPYLSFFTLIGAIIGIVIIQIACLRKRPPSNSHTCISVVFWVIAFIIIVFIYEWLTFVHPTWF